MFRLAWPAQTLQAQGRTDVKVRFPDQRWEIGAKLNLSGEVVGVAVPEDATTLVLQRVTHRHLLGCIPFWRRKGIKVVIDIDDDLTCVHPSNPAYAGLKPNNGGLHDWNYLNRACAAASVVTCSTPALAARYPGNTVVLPNYLPDHYFDLERNDHPGISWPASLGSHPDDASALGGALNRLQGEGVEVSCLGADSDAQLTMHREALSLRRVPTMHPFVDIENWPTYLAAIGVGVAPLSDTRFNEAKSWLKVLELSAVGVPWVASDRADYRRFHELTGVGVLADRAKDWYRALHRLTSDEVARKEASAAGVLAADAFRIRDHTWRWSEIWD